ncbi:MAG: PKD domain-containing protein, partial [Bacteroidota bacterium]
MKIKNSGHWLTICLVVLCPWLTTHAQSNAWAGIQLELGMLHFSNASYLEATYDQLLLDLQKEESSNKGLAESPCGKEPALDAFENALRFSSLRQAYRQAECSALQRGVDPSKIQQLIPDDVLASFLNTDYTLMVEGVIYYIPALDQVYRIANRDLRALSAIQKGANPALWPNVDIIETGGTACQADFAVNTDYQSTTVGFTFTGEPVGGQGASFYWEFGDGETSIAKNPSHDFGSNGSYEVCLTVETKGGEYCYDRLCKQVQVGGGGCQAFFIFNENGNPGELCFLDNSQFLGNVTSWNWNFGDGSTNVQEQNPCHVFPCDKTFFVTLQIGTSDGCSSSITQPVWVNSNSCCAKQAHHDGQAYYNNDQNKILWGQWHIQLPFLRRVHAKMINYKRKSNGNWKRDRTDMKLQVDGNIYIKGAAGCKCDHPVDASGYVLAFNKKTLTYSYKVGESFKTKSTDPWSARYYVQDQLITNQTT